jgi:hypothetical protein
VFKVQDATIMSCNLQMTIYELAPCQSRRLCLLQKSREIFMKSDWILGLYKTPLNQSPVWLQVHHVLLV